MELKLYIAIVILASLFFFAFKNYHHDEYNLKLNFTFPSLLLRRDHQVTKVITDVLLIIKKKTNKQIKEKMC
jgi:hypothetical protein